MSLLQNSSEGGTNGTNLTAANSGGGSGNAFNSVAKGAGATLIYSSTAAAHGTLGYSITGASGTANSVTWNSFNDTSVSVRFYFNPGPVLPNAQLRLIDIRNASGTAARVMLTTANKLFIQNTAGITLFTSASALSTNTWYRIECAISISTTVATMKYDYYALDSTTPVEAGYSTTTGNTGSTNINVVSIGSAASATWTGTSYFDDLATQSNTVSYLGVPATLPPSVAAGSNQTVVPYASVTLAGTSTPTAGHTATVAWTALSGAPAITSGSTTLTPNIANIGGSLVSGGGVATDVTYSYKITATQDDSQTANATVNVTVIYANRYLANSSSWKPQPLKKAAKSGSWV